MSPLQSAVWHTGRWHEPVHPSWNIIYQCALLLPPTNTTKYWGLPNGPIGDGAAGRWSGKCRPCAPATAGLNAAGSVVNGLPDSLVQNISLGAEAETTKRYWEASAVPMVSKCWGLEHLRQWPLPCMLWQGRRTKKTRVALVDNGSLKPEVRALVAGSCQKGDD